MKFWQVDSFTNSVFKGNPACVYVVDEVLSDFVMQNIAAEMNVSETSFVKEVDKNRFHIRWFTPGSEVDLCGHATLAAAHILFSEGFSTENEIFFDSKSGPLSAKRSGSDIYLDFPAQPAKEEPVDALTASIVGFNPDFVGDSVRDRLVLFPTEESVVGFKPDFLAISQLSKEGFLITAQSDDPRYDYIYRGFFPKLKVNEDPVTGSANTVLAPFWASRLGKSDLKAFQASTRTGELSLSLAGDRVQIGGQAVTSFTGTFLGI